ncbi:MAG: hypothetical protein RIS70_3549 [Planctomycetota bacterium]|jgi:serine/threonine protein kinase
MATVWYYRIAGTEYGPISTPELLELAKQGKLRPDDEVKKNRHDWRPASKVQGLFSAEQADSTVGPMSTKSATEVMANGPSGHPTDDAATVSESLPETGAEPSDNAAVLAAGASNPPTSASTTVAPARGRGAAQKAGSSAADDLVQLNAGKVLGNYQILTLLGRGGMGVVLKARHIRMERTVALKVLRSQAISSPHSVKRFQQEVRAAAKLSHPNIVTAYDADEVDQIHFLVMEYVDGRSLSDILAEKGPLSLKEALDYVLQTAIGLEYAHAEGVIHRDIKPGNLLLDKRGVVKILDMGLASMQDSNSDQAAGHEFVTQEHQLLGTFDYMPPEQAEDARSVDARADIYALGCTLFRLLTGRTPYKGETPIKKIIAHRTHPIPSLRDLRSDVPTDLERVFQKMLAKSPDDRFRNMREVIQALEPILAGRTRPITGDEFFPQSSASVDDGSSIGSSSHSKLRPQEHSVYVPAPRDSDEGFTLMASTADERYYWQVMGQTAGPFTLLQLRKKKLSPDDLVRPESSTQWCRASEIRGLFLS